MNQLFRPGPSVTLNKLEPHLVDTPHHSLGALLIDAGKLRAEDAERVLRYQQQHGLRFGDAAVRLGLVGEDDLQDALSRQFDYPYVRSDSRIHDSIAAAYRPFSRGVEVLRELRSQLILRWLDGSVERRALAVLSTAAGEGRSHVAANLAVVFSQLGQHTLLIDADMRRSRQHALFGLDNAVGLSSMLAGRADTSAIQRVPELRDLSVLTAGPPPPNPQELLGRLSFGEWMGRLRDQYEVILIDTPAAADYADALAIVRHSRGALVVSHKNRTRVDALKAMARRMQDAGAQLVGAVVNDY